MAYLTYLELFVIHAVCVWCVGYGLTVVVGWLAAALASVGATRRRLSRSGSRTPGAGLSPGRSGIARPAPATAARSAAARVRRSASWAAKNTAWTSHCPVALHGPPRRTHDRRRLSPSIASMIVEQVDLAGRPRQAMPAVPSGGSTGRGRLGPGRPSPGAGSEPGCPSRRRSAERSAARPRRTWPGRSSPGWRSRLAWSGPGASLDLRSQFSGSPSPAWSRPRAPRPTKLKAWVTIGYRPSSARRELDDRALGGRQVDRLRAPVAGVVRGRAGCPPW